MRIEIDDRGRIIERVCCDCGRTCEGESDLCRRCIDRHREERGDFEPPREWKPEAAIEQDREQEYIGLHWLRLAAELVFSAQRLFLVEADRAEAIRELARIIPQFAVAAWPVDPPARAGLESYYRIDQRLYDACLRYVVDAGSERPDVNNRRLVRDLRIWFDERNRRLDREEREQFEAN